MNKKTRRKFLISDEFLDSFEWKKLRYQMLCERGARCECCGRTPNDGARMNVDHIKPRRFFPQLAFVKDNLQILCHDCNHGKGSWDMTDWHAANSAPRGEVEDSAFQQLIGSAPLCVDCNSRATAARWRVYCNGDVHLVWWCCTAQVGSACIPPEWASRFAAGPRPSQGFDSRPRLVKSL